MILESRSIVFTNDELLVALRPILETKGLSGEEILDDMTIDLDGEGEVMVELTLNERDEPIILNSREIGAAVLNHCIEAKIPLPRGAYKELALRGDMVAMIVRIESGNRTSNGVGAQHEQAEDATAVAEQ